MDASSLSVLFAMAKSSDGLHQDGSRPAKDIRDGKEVHYVYSQHGTSSDTVLGVRDQFSKYCIPLVLCVWLRVMVPAGSEYMVCWVKKGRVL